MPEEKDLNKQSLEIELTTRRKRGHGWCAVGGREAKWTIDLKLNGFEKKYLDLSTLPENVREKSNDNGNITLTMSENKTENNNRFNYKFNLFPVTNLEYTVKVEKVTGRRDNLRELSESYQTLRRMDYRIHYMKEDYKKLFEEEIQEDFEKIWKEIGFDFKKRPDESGDNMDNRPMTKVGMLGIEGINIRVPPCEIDYVLLNRLVNSEGQISVDLKVRNAPKNNDERSPDNKNIVEHPLGTGIFEFDDEYSEVQIDGSDFYGELKNAVFIKINNDGTNTLVIDFNKIDEDIRKALKDKKLITFDVRVDKYKDVTGGYDVKNKTGICIIAMDKINERKDPKHVLLVTMLHETGHAFDLTQEKTTIYKRDGSEEEDNPYHYTGYGGQGKHCKLNTDEFNKNHPWATNGKIYGHKDGEENLCVMFGSVRRDGKTRDEHFGKVDAKFCDTCKMHLRAAELKRN